MKEKTCKVCRIRYTPSKPMQVVCSPTCANNYAWIVKSKAELISIREDRKIVKQKLEKLKTLSQLLREAQVAFNAWVRERDKSLPCVSCGRFHSGAYDAGHYRSVGAASSLRFDPANVHRQCVPCNQHKSGNVLEYRLGLIQRIGIKEVERIEGPLPEVKWTKEQAREIKDIYKRKLKEMQRGN